MRTKAAAIVLLALAGAAFPRAAAAAGPNLSPAAQAQLDEGLKRLYALDYARSRAAFRSVIELEPDNPFGYLFEAGGIWWESSMNYGLFTDTPTLQGLFEADVDAALRAADAYSDASDPRTKADGYFVSGMALGTLGQWRLMKRHWMDAYFIGKKAVKNLKKCLKLDPDYADAKLGLGVFDYQTAHLSGAMKIGILFGLKGDEKKGLANIRFAMENSRTSGRQAAQLLSQIYISDKHDSAAALAVVARLRGDFPQSPYFMFLDALLRHRLGDDAGSLAAAREVYALFEADPAAFRPKWLALACGLSGRDCLSKADAAATLAWFDRAQDAAAKGAPDGFSTFLHLFRGELLDVLGRRDDAVPEYKLVAGRPNVDFSRAAAAACLASPCGRKEVLAQLRALSKEEPASAAVR